MFYVSSLRKLKRSSFDQIRHRYTPKSSWGRTLYWIRVSEIRWKFTESKSIQHHYFLSVLLYWIKFSEFSLNLRLSLIEIWRVFDQRGSRFHRSPLHTFFSTSRFAPDPVSPPTLLRPRPCFAPDPASPPPSRSPLLRPQRDSASPPWLHAHLGHNPRPCQLPWRPPKHSYTI